MKFIIYILTPIYIAMYALFGFSYPYYSAWDSSMFFTLDALIAGSGQLPDHFFHPNMIPLVINGYLLLPLGKLLGFISIDSINSLKLIPNPYLAFVEVTKYLLSIGYLLAYLFITFIFLSFKSILDPYKENLNTKWLFIFNLMIALLSLGWSGLPNMLFWIRYETYGIVFWSLALLTMLGATKSNKPIVLFFCSGILSGCAIFSKIQLIGGVACLPPLYFALAKNPITISKKSFVRFSIPIALFLAAFIGILHIKTYYDFTHKNILDVAFLSQINSSNFIPIGPILALLFLGAVLVISYKYKKVPKLISSNIFIISFFTIGIILVIFISLILGSTFHEKKSALEATYIFSLMFGQFALKYLGDAMGAKLSHQPIVLTFFISSILLIGILRLIKSKNFYKISLREYLFSSFCISILLLSCNILLRNDEPKKDFLMLSAWTMLAGILIVRLFFITITNKKITLIIAFTFSLWFTLMHVYELKNYHKNSFTNNDYYYLKHHWKNFTYGFRQNQYVAIMDHSYPTDEAWNSIFQISKNLDVIRLVLIQIFRDRDITIKDTALGEEESFLNVETLEKIKTLSPELKSSIVIPSLIGNLTITPRADYKTYLVIPSNDLQIQGSYSLTTLNFLTNIGSEKIKYNVYQINMPGITINDNSHFFHIVLKPD